MLHVFYQNFKFVCVCIVCVYSFILLFMFLWTTPIDLEIIPYFCNRICNIMRFLMRNWLTEL